MNLAELIIGEARQRGLRHFFGIPGGGAPLDLMDAGRRVGVDFVNVAHESSAAIMGAYYGQMIGTSGLSLAVKGVGAGNLVGGAVNVYFERGPLVCLCECSPTAVSQREMIQHCDHSGLFGAVVKYQATLCREQAADLLAEAVFETTDGRPGPVLLNLPSDLAGADCQNPKPPRSSPSAVPPDGADLAAARDLIQRSRHPVVLAGADVIRAGAGPALREFVEKISAALMVGVDARGVLAESNPRWCGVFWGMYEPNLIETELLNRADLLVAVGVDPIATHVPWSGDLPVCELAAWTDYEGLTPAPQVRVNGDLKLALEQLSAVNRPGFSTEQVQAVRSAVLRHCRRPDEARFAVQDIIEITRRLLPHDGILISESGAFICILEQLWRVEQPGTFHGTSGGRTMGLMLPAVLGARLAAPELPMVGLGADGSLLMRLGELEVFARTGAVVPLVIVNDHALGTMKSRQKSRGMVDYGLDLQAVDFATIARACGLKGVVVETPEQFEHELKAAMTAPSTTLIDARVDPQPYQDSFAPSRGLIS